MPEKKILVVDDDPGFVRQIVEVLESCGEGYVMVRALGGERALEVARKARPHLMITDWEMPGLSGIETIRKMKADPAIRDIPVIMATGVMTSSESLKTALEAGAVDYVRKPIDGVELVARVRSVLLLADSYSEIRRQRDELADRTARLEKAYVQIRELKNGLEKAHLQIARLEAPNAAWLEEPQQWAAEMASEIGTAIGALRIGVINFDGEQLNVLVFTAIPPESVRSLLGTPRPAEITSLSTPGDGKAAWGVLIRAVSGSPRGAIIVEGKQELSSSEISVLRSFARHLATALELHQFRKELDQAEARRSTTRSEMMLHGNAPVDICPMCGLCVEHKAGDHDPLCPEDDYSLETAHLLPYRINGRYKLLRRLGEGGMGTVYRAYDERLDRNIALKVIRAANLADPIARFRFEREANTMAKVRHPGVVSLFDSGEMADGSAFLVMELLEGPSLDAVLNEYGPGKPKQVAALLRQIGPALGAVHRLGVVHRDVKPSNILLLSGGPSVEAKLLDFGLATSRQFKEKLTQSGFIVGTPAYMSPEQVQGKDADERSDLYALAAVAYEALSGRPIVPRGLDLSGTLASVLSDRPPKLSSLLAGFPSRLDHLFELALAKDPGFRPHDISTWAEQCASALDPVQLDSPPHGWPRNARCLPG